ncbi:hypothetical protein B0H17DRAFT_1153489 [Mycena rosella]|uniref:Uncharacterized protein n=1 Tax=Mycena rosella TaxID=1033263 RepID=A0AAD7B5P7_MYCRO|nr:hypothetical protein B0H17DRAFT_1153489 [Mycena rosella]
MVDDLIRSGPSRNSSGAHVGSTLASLAVATSPEYIDAMPEYLSGASWKRVTGVTAAHFLAEFELRYELGRLLVRIEPEPRQSVMVDLGPAAGGTHRTNTMRGKFESGMDGRPREVDPRSMCSARKPNSNLRWVLRRYEGLWKARPLLQSTFVVNFIGLALPTELEAASRRDRSRYPGPLQTRQPRILSWKNVSCDVSAWKGSERDGAVECSGAIRVVGTFP